MNYICEVLEYGFCRCRELVLVCLSTKVYGTHFDLIK